MPPHEQGRFAFGSFVLGFVAAGALLALGFVSWWVGGWSASSSRFDTSRPTIVRQIQQLQRLQTVVFSLDKIVSGGQESRYLPSFLVGDRLLLVASGEVSAGVDFGAIDTENARIDGRTIELALPPAEVFSTRIDNERTRVYSRETGLFTRVDPNLESDVRRAAEREIEQAAREQGILQAASDNARTTLKAFLETLGFEHVTVH